MDTKLIRKSLRAQEKSGHHNVPGMKSQESFAVPVFVSHVNMCRTQIPNCFANQLCAHQHEESGLKTANAISGHAANFCQPRQNKLHHCDFPGVSLCCRCAQLAGFSLPFVKTSHQSHTIYSYSLQTVFNELVAHEKFMSCSIFGLGIRFVIKSEGVTLMPTFFVTIFSNWMSHAFTVFRMSTCFALPKPLRLTKHIVGEASRCRFSSHAIPRSFVTFWIFSPF